MAKRYRDRISHFAHYAGAMCAAEGAGVSEAHRRLQALMAETAIEVLRRLGMNGFSVEMEVSGAHWRADVFVRIPDGSCWALEIQTSTQATALAAYRTTRYEASEVETVWIAVKNRPTWSRGIPTIVLDGTTADAGIILGVKTAAGPTARNRGAEAGVRGGGKAAGYTLNTVLQGIFTRRLTFDSRHDAFCDAATRAVNPAGPARRAQTPVRHSPAGDFTLGQDASILFSEGSVALRKAKLVARDAGGRITVDEFGQPYVSVGERRLDIWVSPRSLDGVQAVLCIAPLRVSAVGDDTVECFDRATAAVAWLRAGRST